MIRFQVNFSWQDLREHLGEDFEPYSENYSPIINDFQNYGINTFQSLVEVIDSRILYFLNHATLGSYYKKIIGELLNIVYSKHKEDYCFTKNIRTCIPKSLSEIYGEYIEAAGESFYSNLYSKIEESVDRFLPMFKLFEDSQAGNLIPKLESSTNGAVLFSDVPQTDTSSTDGSITNRTESSSSTTADSGPLMEKLEEVRKYNAAILNEWSQLFDGLFIINVGGEEDELL